MKTRTLSHKPSNILRRAADELVRHGWTHGTLGTPKGAKCALGAIQCVAYPRRQIYEYDFDDGAAIAVKALADRVKSDPNKTDAGVGSIWLWNDRGTTADVVITTMRRVAYSLKSRGQ